MVLKTTGLAGRDFELTNAPKSVKLYNTDDFQVSAVSATPGAAVSLEVSTWRVCLHADGRQYRAPFFPSAMSSPQRFVVKSYGCDPGWFLDILQFQIQAVARKGEAIGKSAKATLTFSPWLLEVPVDVLEQACGWTQVPSVSVQPGDRVNITAGGTIKTVIWWPFDGWQVGAAGMTHSPAPATDGCPLAGVPRYGLIGRIASWDAPCQPVPSQDCFYVGTRRYSEPSSTAAGSTCA